MKLLDLFCGAGGAAMGYHRAGFDVSGVDIKEQPNYPFEFIQGDVFDLICFKEFREQFDVIHASPPCQAFSKQADIHRRNGTQYEDLLTATQEILRDEDTIYIIENVESAPLSNQKLMLCGTMFNLPMRRHRFFESNAWIYPPGACKHWGTIRSGEMVCVVGHGGGVKYGGVISTDRWSDAMGIDWMTKQELTQAIPPAYTEWIGKLLIGTVN